MSKSLYYFGSSSLITLSACLISVSPVFAMKQGEIEEPTSSGSHFTSSSQKEKNVDEVKKPEKSSLEKRK